MREWIREARSRRVVRIAARTALVVGTLLNLINLGPGLLLGLHPLPLVPLLLNYCVPYGVATYGAVSFARSEG